jgi:signal transduction histidine kinase/DNA-binding response OmpR family regulator
MRGAVVGSAWVIEERMPMSRFLLRRYDADTAAVFKELLQDSLRIFVPTTVVAVWLWAAYVMLLVRPHFVDALVSFVLILVIAVLSYYLSRKHLSMAIGTYIVGLTVVVTLIALAFRDVAVFYLYVLVVLVTAMLTNARLTLVTAVACIGLVLFVNRTHLMPLGRLVLPMAFILLAALTSWLGSQRLFLALDWALSMTREAQKNAEEARKHRAEVQRVLKGLDEAYVRLERTNEALALAQESAAEAYGFKTEFVANVSHELRTPLNLIVGFSEMMATAPESYGGASLPSEYRGDVMAIYRNARHLSDLIDDVLDLSRIEAGRMPLIKEEVDLGEVVCETADMVRGLAEARGLRLEVDVPDDLPRLRLDRTRIRQVLLNLLTNATRFTDEGWIRAQLRVRGEEASVTVEDSGRGISPERINRAFEAFSQLEDGRAREGSGLGLAVSKRFVELHGGRMWIESEVGHGTTVGFAFPLPKDGKEVPLSRLIGASTPSGYGGQPLVLTLHDDPRAISLLQRYVEGYQFVAVETVGEARELIRETHPSAVIVNSAWTGRQPVTAQELNLPPTIPLLTCPLPSMRRLGVLLGAADYLPKPVTQEDLQQVLSRLPRPLKTVLVVDDNPHVVRLFSRMLRANDASLRILEAFSGKEGLEIARAERPDVVLLDLVMPEVDGYAFLAEVANDETLANVQVVIVSVRSVEQESAPLQGEVRVDRAGDFSFTETMQLLRAMLSAVTRPSAMAPGSAATLPEARVG